MSFVSKSTIDLVYHYGVNSAERLCESRRLSDLLIAVAERESAEFAAIVEPLGIPGYVARAVLMLEDPEPMRDLANQLDCDRSFITNIADHLEESGLATRVQGTDRRFKIIELTPKGRELRAKLSDELAKHSLVQEKLDDAQRLALGSLLELLLAD
jgi:DNA-binding MarR family transcriptional regulator